MKRQVMTVEQQAEKLIDEAYQYAPSSGGTKEVISIRIAIWGAERSHSITANGLGIGDVWASKYVS